MSNITENYRIINIKLAEYLLYNIQNTNLAKLFKKSFIYFMIAHNKIFIKYNLYIYIGNIDDKKIFQSEIMICCSSDNECNNIFI